MKIYTDQMNRKISLTGIPRRIVSLVPSQTELLVSLGLSDHIVGVTKFCVHPNGLRKEKIVVGGTKKVDYDIIKKLNPDIILCNKEENTKDIVVDLQNEYPVHVSDIFSIEDAIEMMQQYGELFGKENEANTLTSKIKEEKQSFLNFIANKPQKKVAYFIWRDPWMVAGKNTFVDYLLKINNFINAFDDEDRYPEVSSHRIASLDALDLILLSSEPFPFAEKHIKEIQKINPNAKVVLVDGEYFSWYGSRLINAFQYFKTLHR